jgi:hypothetical protein
MADSMIHRSGAVVAVLDVVMPEIKPAHPPSQPQSSVDTVKPDAKEYGVSQGYQMAEKVVIGDELKMLSTDRVKAGNQSDK